MQYFFRRTVHGVLVLLCVSLACFLLLRLAPGEFVSDMRLDPQVSPATLDALRQQFGLDRPLPAQYWGWLRSSTRGEFGYSFAYNQPVSKLLWPRLRNTLLLNTIALALAWALALLLGVMGAARPGGWMDRLGALVSSVLFATPELMIALLLLLVAARTGWFAVGGMVSLDTTAEGSSWRTLQGLAAHLVLPVVTIVLVTFPPLYRHVRASMAVTLTSSFVDAARGYGLRFNQILLRQALPAATNPLITLLGISFGQLLSASLLVEIVFSWPGLGPMMLESILARDVYVIVGIVFQSAMLVVIGNLFADVLLYWSDPRIRMEPQ